MTRQPRHSAHAAHLREEPRSDFCCQTEIMNKFGPGVVLTTLIKPEGNRLSSETKRVLQEILFNLYSNSGTLKFQPENRLQSLS